MVGLTFSSLPSSSGPGDRAAVVRGGLHQLLGGLRWEEVIQQGPLKRVDVCEATC